MVLLSKLRPAEVVGFLEEFPLGEVAPERARVLHDSILRSVRSSVRLSVLFQ